MNGSLQVSWHVENVGIGRTDLDHWADTVTLASNADGSGVVSSFSFDHLGVLAVNTGYDRSVDLALANGFTCNYYVFV